MNTMQEFLSENILECQELVAGYELKAGFVRAVDGVSFSLRRGEFLGIAGESGCGKTTLAYAVMRLFRDNAKIRSGKILYSGKDIANASEEEVKNLRWEHISMVFQSAMNALNPVLPIGEQLTDAWLAHKHGDLREAKTRALEVLKLVDIPEDRYNAYPHQLSGGMKQRVVIAMALACEPVLLIADEPTTALDVTIQAQVISMIRNLRDTLGTAMIMITHDLGVVGEVCDHVAVMYAGKIVETGTLEQIFGN